MKLFAAGIGHKTTPVELREQLAVKQPAIGDLAFLLKCFGHLDEIVLLSTCNRVEIYGTTERATGHIKSLLQLLLPEPCDLDRHIYLYEGAAAEEARRRWGRWPRELSTADLIPQPT